jgi:hypothetical protein
MLAAALVVLAGAAAWVVPWLTRERDIPAAVPSPRALREVDFVNVERGREACAPDVGLDERSREARMVVGTFGRPGPAFRLLIEGDGYRSVTRVRGGYADNLTHMLPVRPTERAALVRVCVRNEGRSRLALAASSDSTRSRSIAVVGSRPVGRSYWLSFHERSEHSILGRLPDTVERMTAFRPGVVGGWLLWPLGLLALAGVPLGVLWAWRRGLAAEDAAYAESSQAANDAPSTSGTASRGTA